MTDKTAALGGWRWGRLIAGFIVFELLMSFRDELASPWTRAVMAGSAFAVLALTLSFARKARQ